MYDCFYSLSTERFLWDDVCLDNEGQGEALGNQWWDGMFSVSEHRHSACEAGTVPILFIAASSAPTI